LHEHPAFADGLVDEDPPPEPAPPPPPTPTPPGQTTSIPEPPSAAPSAPADAKTPLEQISRPPHEPVPVPNPSPVVLGGVPTPPGQAAVPLQWKRARFSKADVVILIAGSALTLGAP
jgi:hypothetical protein